MDEKAIRNTYVVRYTQIILARTINPDSNSAPPGYPDNGAIPWLLVYLCNMRGLEICQSVACYGPEETAYRDKPCCGADYGFHRATPCRRHCLGLAVP